MLRSSELEYFWCPFLDVDGDAEYLIKYFESRTEKQRPRSGSKFFDMYQISCCPKGWCMDYKRRRGPRHDIFPKFYTARFSGYKFYTTKVRNLRHFFSRINRVNASNINNLCIFGYKWVNYKSVNSFRDEIRIKCTLYFHLYCKSRCF